MPITLTTANDPRFDPFRMLPERLASTQEVVAESELAVGRWLGSSHPVRALLTTPERWPRLEPLLPAGVEAFLAPIAVIREVVGFRLRRGVVACGPRPTPQSWVERERYRIVLAEGLSDPKNLGALIRNCRAFGVDEVVVTPRSADPFSRRAIRAAAGHGFEFPVRVESVDATLRRLSDAQWIATTPAAPKSLRAFTPSERWVLVVGNEGAGISPEVQERCADRIRIPLAPGVDSLNVAAATAVCLHTLCPDPSQ